MADAYKVAIIGAGRIGAGFDTLDSSHVLTHAHAIAADPRFTLSALVDVDVSRGEAEAKKWNTRFFADAIAMFDEIRPDVVVIASPDSTHAPLLAEAATYQPKIIVCEKPIITSVEQEALVRGIEVPVVVNFSRRFDPVTEDVRQGLRSGRYGKVLSASGIYTRGVVHNGSHLIDLARYLFGEVTRVTAVVPGVPDYPLGVDSVGSVLSLERCERFFLMPADARVFAVFEMDILTERARIRFIDESRTLVTQEVIDDPIYDGYRILGPETRSETGLLHSLEHLYEHIVEVIERDAPIISSLESALATNAACLSIVEEYKKR